MEVLDVQPYETALQRLFYSGVCSDEQLYDYQLSQALRSLTYASNRKSVTAPNVTGSVEASSSFSSSASQVTTTGSVALLYRMSLFSILSLTHTRTAVFLSTQLLCGEATSFGEGNERPCCASAWIDALCCVSTSFTGEKSYMMEQMSLHSRLGLGYVLILTGTVREVARGTVTGKRFASHYPGFVQRILTDVVPYLVLMADRRESRSQHMIGNSRGSSNQNVLVVAQLDTYEAPSRLQVEANNAIIHLLHHLSGDMLIVHQEGRRDHGDGHVVLDRDLPGILWSNLPALRRALARALKWIQSEAIWLFRQNPALTTNGTVQAMDETFVQVHNLLDTVVTRLIRQQEMLECARGSAEQEFGIAAKCYHDANEAIWANTHRLCFLVRNITNAWVRVHGGVGDLDVERSEKALLAFIATFVSSVPLMEERENEKDVFLATVTLLSAVLATVSAAPLAYLQASLWEADTRLTQEIHNIIVQRGLRFKNEEVQKLSALLSQLILYSSTPSSSIVHSLTDSSDHLLQLLSQGRDAASQCVTGMLTRAIIERPHALLPAIFRLLQHGDLSARRNALDLLAALPEITENKTVSWGKTFSIGEMRPVLRLLAEELLLRLQDEELVLRLQASKLFAKVYPDDVCRPLLNLAAKKDNTGRKQSAAQESLLSMTTAHTNDSKIILLLLQESLLLLGEGTPSIRAPPNTPADMLAFSQLHHASLTPDPNDCSDDHKEGQNHTSNNGSPHQRIVRLLLLLVRKWSEHVSTWSETLFAPLLDSLMKAKTLLEQELNVRIMAVVASVCGVRDDGAFALLSACCTIMKGDTGMGSWVDVVHHSAKLEKEEAIYYSIAPLLCLRTCPRYAFASKTLDGLLPPAREIWYLTWKILLDEAHHNKRSNYVQRLLLENACKYSTELLLCHLACLESDLCNRRQSYVSTGPGHADDDAFFFYRIGYFCVSSLLSRNEVLLRAGVPAGENVEGSKERGTSEASGELELLVRAATMAAQWTGDIVLPWILSEDDVDSGEGDVHGPQALCYANRQRVSRAAVDCMALLVIAALSHTDFYPIVNPFMRPLTDLTSLLRDEVRKLTVEDSANAKDRYEQNAPLDNNVFGRFEIVVHVHRAALALLRAHPLGKEVVPLWFAEYMQRLVDLSNAACVAATRLGQKQATSVAVECCHLLFLGVMVSGSSGTSHAASASSPLDRRGGVMFAANQSNATLMGLSAQNKEALRSFAIGSARYSSLAEVQSEGVRLLSALLGAAPEVFLATCSQEAEALHEALAVLRSVALMNPDAVTRGLAERVLDILERNEAV